MKTRIQCKNNKFHTVEFDDEWNLVYADCKNADERASRMASIITLGGRSRATKRGCAALVGLIRHALPSAIFATDFGDEIDFGGWDEVYTRYEENKLTKARMNQLMELGRAEYPEIAHAEKALFSCRYRPDIDAQDRRNMTAFRPNDPCEVGTVVGYGQYDPWVVPLQKGWLQNIGEKGLAIVNRRFVCGVKEKGNLLVVDRLPEGEFAICEKKAG